MISVDLILDQIDGWGRYQKAMFFFMSLPTFMAGYTVLGLSWTGFNMGYRCLVPDCENATSATYNAPFLNFTTPRLSNPASSDFPWDKCFTFSSVDPAGGCSVNNFDPGHRVACSKWVYDTSVMQSTIISEFELSCGRGWLPALANSLYMGGMFTGSLVLGHLSDRFGRKIAMVLSFCIVGISTTLQAFSPSFGFFAALRFLAGIGGMGIFMVCFLISVETVANTSRTFCGFAIHFFFASGAGFVGALAIVLREWRYLQLALALPVFLLVSYWWFIPESPRWLAAQGKEKQLEENLRKAARVNGAEFPEHLLKKAAESDASSGLNTAADPLPDMSVRDLFSSPKLRWRTCIIMYQWFVCAMVYYGLGMNATSLGSSVHLNFILMQLIEIPACIVCIWTLDPWGRKLTLLLSFFLCGLGSIASGLVNSSDVQWLTVTLAVIGKFGGSATFAIVFIYGAELFPTELRNSGIGLSSAAGRIGSISAPFIASLGVDSQVLPMSIFGGLSILGGILTLFLPETYGQRLPDTIQETEAFGSDQTVCHIPCMVRRRRKHSLQPPQPADAGQAGPMNEETSQI